jgi:hypothetical protein
VTKEIHLKSGGHNPKGLPGVLPDMCVMEATYYEDAIERGVPLADVLRDWTDHPSCTCPVITSFAIKTNDEGSDAQRNATFTREIRDLMRGTRGSRDLQQRRAYALADWAVHVCAVAALRSAGLTDAADRLAALPEIVDKATSAAAEAAAAARAVDARAAARAVDARAAAATAWAAARAADAAAAASAAAWAAWASAAASAAAAARAADAASAAAAEAWAAARAADAAAAAAADAAAARAAEARAADAATAWADAASAAASAAAWASAAAARAADAAAARAADAAAAAAAAAANVVAPFDWPTATQAILRKICAMKDLEVNQ